MAARGRTPSSSPAATIRRASVIDSSSMVTPPATACRISAAVLPGPAKLTWSLPIRVSSAVCISSADATSIESTRPARCWTTAGIGLAFMA